MLQQGDPTDWLTNDPDWHTGPGPVVWQDPCGTHIDLVGPCGKQQPPPVQSLADVQPHTPAARHVGPQSAELQSPPEVQPHPDAVQALPSERVEQFRQAPPPGPGQTVPSPVFPTHFPPLQQVRDAHCPAPPSQPGGATQLPPEQMVPPLHGVFVIC
jgi:hypothetical protein